MVKLTGTIARLSSQKVLVIGDFLLDSYTIGKASRISPEAPVAVVTVQREEHRPGGAGNVVLNLLSMGCKVIAVGRTGSDAAGERLLKALMVENTQIDGMITQRNYQTPVKNRIVAGNQQIVRIDNELNIPLSEALEQTLIDKLPFLLEKVKVIAISDYGKGFLTRTLLTAVIEEGKRRGIPIIADPKGIDFSKYSGSTVIKPNLNELYAASGLTDEASLDQVAAKVLTIAQCATLMVTRSEKGISLFHQTGMREDFPVRAREVKDVTGAGDTVLAMAACALANGLEPREAALLANEAASIAIERFGCARVSLSDLTRRLVENDMQHKIFDEEHLFALSEALKGRRVILMAISSEQGLNSTLFNSMRQVTKQENSDLVIFIKEEEPDAEFVNLLASLHEVSFILINGTSLRTLCERVTPAEIYEIREEGCQRLSDMQVLLSSSFNN